MTVWIGLTGGIGSGKSQVAAEFVRLGVPHIDADAISHSLTDGHGVALPAICRAFGEGVLDEHGFLNRSALRELVFRRPQAKEMLEQIMYPLILDAIRAEQHNYPEAAYGVLDVPLLIERPAFLDLVQRVLVVDVAETTQMSRVQQRSGMSEEEIHRIMATQATRRQRLLQADDVLKNEGSLNDLAVKVARLNQFYRNLFRFKLGKK